MSKNYKVSASIVQSKDISAVAKLILGVVLSQAEYRDPESLVLVNTGAEIGVDLHEIRTRIAELANKGFIKVDGCHPSQATQANAFLELRLHLYSGQDKNGQKEIGFEDDADSDEIPPVDKRTREQAGGETVTKDRVHLRVEIARAEVEWDKAPEAWNIKITARDVGSDTEVLKLEDVKETEEEAWQVWDEFLEGWSVDGAAGELAPTLAEWAYGLSTEDDVFLEPQTFLLVASVYALLPAARADGYFVERGVYYRAGKPEEEGLRWPGLDGPVKAPTNLIEWILGAFTSDEEDYLLEPETHRAVLELFEIPYAPEDVLPSVIVDGRTFVCHEEGHKAPDFSVAEEEEKKDEDGGDFACCVEFGNDVVVYVRFQDGGAGWYKVDFEGQVAEAGMRTESHRKKAIGEDLEAWAIQRATKLREKYLASMQGGDAGE